MFRRIVRFAALAISFLMVLCAVRMPWAAYAAQGDAEPPVITGQPEDRDVPLYGTAALEVTVAAPEDGGTLRYQWFVCEGEGDAGAPVDGAVSSCYSAPTGTAGTMYYACEVTNTNEQASGAVSATVRSRAARVTVSQPVYAEPPVITGEPEDADVLEGAAVTLAVTAAAPSDEGVLSYQWYVCASPADAGVPIGDAVSQEYAAPTGAAGVAYYACVVTNTKGEATATVRSRAARVKVSALVDAEAPDITGQPADADVLVGEAAALAVQVADPSDGGVLGYQWYACAGETDAGEPIEGATAASYGAPTGMAGAAYYACAVTNTNEGATGEKTATVRSRAALVTVSDPVDAAAPAITVQPSDTMVDLGETAALAVAATGTGTLSYQWYGNGEDANSGGEPVSGATEAGLHVPAGSAGTSYYYCVVTNTDNGATGCRTAEAVSDAAKVAVLDTDARLSSLTATAGTLAPAFDAGTTAYTLSLDQSTVGATIEAAAASVRASLSARSIPVQLANGETATVRFTVTAENGGTREYIVTVSRAMDGDCTLSSLTATAGTLSPSFHSGTTSYTLTLDTATAGTTLHAAASSGLATLNRGSAEVEAANGASQTVTFTVTAQNGSSRDYTVVVAREDFGSICFTCKDRAGAVYSGVGLGLYSDEELTNLIGRGTTDATGAATIDGLAEGRYRVTVLSVPAGYVKPDMNIRVATEEGRTFVYTLEVDRKESYVYAANQLRGIEAAGALSPAFHPETMKYTLRLDEYTAKTTIRPVPADSASKLYISGRKAASKTVSLKTGQKTTVKMQVKPKKGKSLYYTVTVVRDKSTNADLASLKASRGALQPAFEAGTTTYTLGLLNTQASVKLTPALANRYARYTLTVNGKKTTNRTVSLKPGETKKVVFTVKAQAGNTKAYTVEITRAISHNADLARLKVNRGTLQPAFEPGVTEYALALTGKQSSVKLTMKTADVYGKCTIKVNGRKSGATVSLKKGETKTVTIAVKAQAGEVKTYTVVITRGS